MNEPDPPAPHALGLRHVAHLDMDAFYASVELQKRPHLQGQAVVIGGRRLLKGGPGGPDEPGQTDESSTELDWGMPLRDYRGRGVVTTATYAARALGVHSGMGLMKAAQLAPQARLLPCDFDAYRRQSQAFKAAVRERAPRIEDRGIDEIFIELTPLVQARLSQGCTGLGADEVARAIALELKEAVRHATGLSCSIGVAPNKLLAKICSDLNKPDGLTMVMHGDVASRIWPLPVGRVPGIGPKAQDRLHAMGIASVGDLAACAHDTLVQAFGLRQANWMLEAASGQDQRPLVEHRDPKSMSRETTFERDLHPRHDRAVLGPLLTQLCERVAADLQRKGFVGRHVGVKLRYDDFRIVTRSITLPQPTLDAAQIRLWAGRCLKGIALDQRLRLMGVKVSGLSLASQGLVPQVGQTAPLFDAPD